MRWHMAQDHVPIDHEVALAYNPETNVGRKIARAHHRDYSDVKPGEIGGTLDAISYDPATATLTVRDWKTGKPVTPARENMQLACGVLAARSLYQDAQRFVVELVYLKDDGSMPYVDSAELHAMDLDSARQELRDALKHHAKAAPTPGNHCTSLYCPARGTCPATVSAMVELSGVSTASIEAMVSRSIRSPDDVARVWPLLQRAEEIIKASKDKVRSIVEREGGVALNGTVLRISDPVKRETFSKARIPAAKRDEVLADLRAMGALTETESRGYLTEKKA
jgi:hypothetical protein